MLSSREINRTELRIKEIDALQQTIDQLQHDLLMYGEVLRRELTLLQEEAAAAPPADPEGLESLDELQTTEAELPETANLDEAAFQDIDEDLDRMAQTPAPRSPFELDDMEGGADKIGGKPVSVLISDGTVSEEPLNGWVLDRPAGGLKILVDDDIKPGRVIGVRPNREHPDAQWINVSVKHSKPERQSFLITCQFVERPPWKALALFNG